MKRRTQTSRRVRISRSQRRLYERAAPRGRLSSTCMRRHRAGRSLPRARLTLTSRYTNFPALRHLVSGPPLGSPARLESLFFNQPPTAEFFIIARRPPLTGGTESGSARISREK